MCIKFKNGCLNLPIGGGGAFRKKDFLECGGYNININRGEETELGYRLNNAGYKILGILTVMGEHNFDFKNIFSFITPIKNMSLSYIYNFLDNDYSHDKMFYNQANRNFKHSIGLMLFLLLIIFISIIDITISIVLLLFTMATQFIYIKLHKKKFTLYFQIEKYGIMFYQVFYYIKYKLFNKKPYNQIDDFKKITIHSFN